MTASWHRVDDADVPDEGRVRSVEVDGWVLSVVLG